ncbi:hypothetical protein HMI55_002220 [Coelomomyces lativittatus]|nr:hypothetical protein HMI55_002220 [Coelomomyces lativittatus]
MTESSFSSAGIPVFSNSKCFRMDPKVPLMTPTANPDHLTLIKGRKGFIVTNPNCSTTGLVVILKALTNAFGPIHQVHVVTLQAMSGAGYPGIPSLDLFDNCVPYIEGEEEKMAMETQKILGTCQGTSIEHASSMKVSATCTRVPVIDGHTLVVSVSFERRPVPSIQDVMHALKTYAPEGLVTACPTYTHSIHVFEQGVMDRPQPRLDRDLHQGMAVSIGRIRTCPILDIQFVALLHNTILGAAGSTLMNAELAELNGYFSSNSP